VLDATDHSAGLWREAARQGLDHPVLADAARQIAQLGADALDHLGLTAAQKTEVLADLALRVETIPTSRRRSA
jgi:hypothetical protein